ncbi:carboxypeptidase-like regulatory domain-containing protein [Winogradskyella sp. 3972H.M.0a.05]|uniref:carboxypeptidase-like regulatory domain-containing protein n=1 Tax=Winogradskyella sp. 3972H.M.0a.05 TaxID=2950277 RepID=UPI003394E0EF
MKRISLVILLFSAISCLAQSKIKTLKGNVVAKTELEGIHILNLSQSKYSTTDSRGNFVIPARVNDTIAISSVKYKAENVIINQSHLDSETLTIILEEKINELDEVIVGKVLTGNLTSDIANTEVKDDINFYDVGIPGYTGKQMTLNEARLYDADYGKYFYFYGIAASVNVYKILNKISGRTKKLKNRVKAERLNTFVLRIRDLYLEPLFENETFTEAQIAEFFYFCSDDDNFVTDCKTKDDITVLELLRMKLSTYKENLKG